MKPSLRHEKSDSIAIVGMGRVGSSLAMALKRGVKGYSLHSFVSARTTSFDSLSSRNGPAVIILATKDDAIEEISRRVLNSAGKNLKLIVHLSGSRPSTILPARSGVARLTMHPIQTFAGKDPTLFADANFMVSSGEPSAIRWGRRFARALGGGEVTELPGELLPLYHTIVSIGANFTTLLIWVVEDLSARAELDPKVMKRMIGPLMRRSLANALSKSAAKALTGPLARRDLNTIAAHRRALRGSSPEIRRLYDAFVAYGLSKSNDPV